MCVAATWDATNSAFALLKVDVFIFTSRVEEKRQWRKTKAFAENTSLLSQEWPAWIQFLCSLGTTDLHLRGCNGLPGESRNFSLRSKHGPLWSWLEGVKPTESSLEPAAFSSHSHNSVGTYGKELHSLIQRLSSPEICNLRLLSIQNFWGSVLKIRKAACRLKHCQTDLALKERSWVVRKPEGHLGNWGKDWTETCKLQLPPDPQHI